MNSFYKIKFKEWGKIIKSKTLTLQGNRWKTATDAARL